VILVLLSRVRERAVYLEITKLHEMMLQSNCKNAARLSGISHLAIRICFDKSKQITKANGVSIELTLGFQDTI
jgi:hypothetical protein